MSKTKKSSKVELSEKDKLALIGYMTDEENVFDDFVDFTLITEGRIPADFEDDDFDDEKEEAYYELVRKFVEECRQKLLAEYKKD